MITKEQITIIHVAKSQIKMDDEEYRSLLQSVCKVNTAKEIRTKQDFIALMRAFEKLGFKSRKIVDNLSSRQRLSDGTITPFQKDFIERLWQKVTRNPEAWRDSLNAFLLARFFAQDVDALGGNKATRVIEALKSMLTKKVLQEVFSIIYPDDKDEIVQNKLLEIYKTIESSFELDDMAAMLAAMIYSNPELIDNLCMAQQHIKTSFEIHPKPKTTEAKQ